MAKPSNEQTMAGSGVIYSAGKAQESPRDFLTWHDRLPYRIWIHSRITETGYKQAGVEVEWLGPKSTVISDAEYKFRLDLAAMRAGALDTSELGPSTFRNIALGQLLEEHAKLITTQRANRIRIGKRNINLVKDYELLKYKLGRIPTMVDFLEHGSRDPELFVDYKKSYYNFIKSVDLEIKYSLSSVHIKILELFSNEINNAVRIEENIILLHLIEIGSLKIDILKRNSLNANSKL
jgi:hypothetical protein